jgi:hypothetical protein
MKKLWQSFALLFIFSTLIFGKFTENTHIIILC